MPKPIQVQPRTGYRIWIAYDDGVKGEVDLAHLAGKGVFALWNNRAAFEQVYIGENGQIAWSDEIDLCPDALYLEITGQSPEQLFPRLAAEGVRA
jgi:hypothetical protein